MEPYLMHYNEHSSSDFGVILYDYEAYGGGQNQRTSTAIAGRQGQLVSEPTYKSNLTIDVTLSVFKPFKPKIDQLKQWLSGTGTLIFSDQAECFFKVVAIDWGDIDREIRKYGRFSVQFTCTPYKYRSDGQNEYSQITQNPYALARPIYKITGEGMCTLMVNGNEMTANAGQNLTIDTDLMMAYRQDGTLQNTAVTGDYEDLYLVPGDNVISITSGFDLKIIPNWGYEI